MLTQQLALCAAVYAGWRRCYFLWICKVCVQEAVVEALPVVDGVLERGARGCASPLAPT